MMISVLVANYNNGRFIIEALESVFNQTYSNWEVVIVDDGSTDNSKDILKKYEEHKQIRIYHNEENRGCGYTKNRCVELADGNICGFLDPDDKLDLEALELMVDAHQHEKKAGLIYSTYFVCDEKLVPQFIPDWIGDFDKGESQLYAQRISHFSTFKKEIYHKTDGINTTLKRAVDQDLYLKLEEIADTKHIDRPLYYYRKHSDGISTFENKYKAKYWHLMISLSACERRGIDKEEFFADFLQKHCGEVNIKNSREYKLGKILLKPFRQIQRWVK